MRVFQKVGKKRLLRVFIRVHIVYNRTAISAFFEHCASRVFNNFRVFNGRAEFDSPASTIHPQNSR